MVTILIQDISGLAAIAGSAFSLARSLGKETGVLLWNQKGTVSESDVRSVLSEQSFVPDSVVVLDALDEASLSRTCDSIETSFLFIRLVTDRKPDLRRYLKACRGLRVPYVFFKNAFSFLDVAKVLVPVGFLTEEIEKAQFAAAFGRFCDSEITLLQARDYGSKAAVNIGKIKSVLDKFSLKFHVQQGEKDSFKIEYEAVQKAQTDGYGLVIASASREYGPDDLIFGPKEFHLVRRSVIPVLLINPRADLYVLCD